MNSTTHRGEMIRGWSVSGDLFGSVMAGLLIGLGLDAVFHTSPIFVIVFIVVAAVGGFYKVYASSSRIEEQAEEALRIRRGL